MCASCLVRRDHSYSRPLPRSHARQVRAPLAKPVIKRAESDVLALRGGASPDFGRFNTNAGLCATGFLGLAAAFRPQADSPMLSFDLAKKIFTVIYSIFFLQFLLVPTFFQNENFVPVADSTSAFPIFFMRLFGWSGITALWLLSKADADIALKFMAVANAGYCWLGPMSAELTHEVTAKHIVPCILLPICSAVTLATTF